MNWKACISALTFACGSSAAPSEGPPQPASFPDVPVPADNAYSEAKAELGRFLFYDTRLSANQTQSCASCHHQDKAFTDGLATSIGSTGEHHPRNANGLTNAGYNATLTWANPLLTTLERQILGPIFGEHPIELGATGHSEEILARIVQEPRYDELFENAFPGNATVDWDHIVQALATFVRTLNSGDSPFDRFVYQGDRSALSTEARAGMELFYSERLECHHCHGGFNFSEATTHAGAVFDSAFFHNTGLYNIDGAGGFPADNTGVHAITGRPEDMGRFRAPSLRNVQVTGPYMHDGSVATLDEVIRFYEAGGRNVTEGPYVGDGRASPLKSGLVPGFELTDAERQALLAFLHSLTDQTFLHDPRIANPWP